MKRMFCALTSLLAFVISVQPGCKKRENITGSDMNPIDPGKIARTISVVEAKTLIDSLAGDPDFMIIDVRTPSEFQGGHIENAVNMNFRDSGFGVRICRLDKSWSYLICCASGNRSEQAQDLMKDAGFMTLYNLAGGISAWRNAGYPVVT